MKNNKIISYTIVALSFVFIPVYLFDGIREICMPFKGLGFPYKSLTFYVLKLIYAFIFFFGGIYLLKKKSVSWHLMMFSSTGMLISCGLFYFKGYIFRSTGLDLFFLEIPSFFMIILFNISCFTENHEISTPNRRLTLLAMFVIINFVLNYVLFLIPPLAQV